MQMDQEIGGLFHPQWIMNDLLDHAHNSHFRIKMEADILKFRKLDEDNCYN